MAPSKKPQRRTKPTMKQAKRMVTKEHKAKAKRNMDTFFFKAKYTGSITPQQGTTVSNYIWFNPSLMDNGAPWNVTNNTEFRLYAALYDKVRINSIKLTYTPKANVLDQTIGQNDAAYTLTGDGMIHTAIDRDGGLTPNIARIMRYPSYKKFSVMKTFSRTYAIRWPTGVWLDAATLAYSNSDQLLSRMGCFGTIGLYAENLIEDKLEIFNEPLADIRLEYNCVFQGKTSASLGVDPDTGVITVKPDTSTPASLAPTFDLLRGHISGDKRYDLSGSLVSVDDNDLP